MSSSWPQLDAQLRAARGQPLRAPEREPEMEPPVGRLGAGYGGPPSARLRSDVNADLHAMWQERRRGVSEGTIAASAVFRRRR